jgi:hypothetical protein
LNGYVCHFQTADLVIEKSFSFSVWNSQLEHFGLREWQQIQISTLDWLEI